MSKKLLVQDAQGKLYALPADMVKQQEVPAEHAKALVQADSRTAQRKQLEGIGVITQIEGAELPNFRLLMQTEYPD